MLPLSHRLRKTADIRMVFKNGQVLKEGLLLLKKSANDSEFTRFAFIVSLKVSKKATLRNKIRRRLSEIVRAKLPEIKSGLDIILIGLPGIEKEDFEIIEKMVNNALIKARIINGR